MILYFLKGIALLLLFSANSCICNDPKDNIASEIINDIHKELDDNNDGEVDATEAEEFAKDELKYKLSAERAKIFKNKITKESMWKSWKLSEVHNWTVEDVIVWLTVHVDLPEYTLTFLAHNITGTLIPRLALSDTSLVLTSLSISNSEHRKKISLCAKELILFGIPEDVERKFFKDKLAFEVIKQLHSQLDDDHDGGVDPQEADEFVRDELKYTSDFDRAKGFNKNDNHISKEEMWRNWKSSEVFNWTVSDVLEWLISHVELPEYADIFKANQISGSIIPRLALSDMSYLIKDLKIKNPVHRKKILLKSTDLILFGPPKKNHSKLKDAVLLILMVLTPLGCWVAFFQDRYSKRQLRNMQDKMNQLGKAEDSLCKLQDKLEEAEIQNSRVTSEKLKIEEQLKGEIEKFKEEIFRSDSNDDFFKSKQIDDHLYNQLNLDQSFSQNFKTLLQMTYEVEGHFFSVKRLSAEQQMRNVRDTCEKLRKKKSTFIGSIKMAHSGNLDDLDKQLSEAKHSIDEVRNELNERSQRWECIEKLTNFKIFPTPGLAILKSTFKSNNIGVSRNKSLPAATLSLCPQKSPIDSTTLILSTTANLTNHIECVSNKRPASLNLCTGESRDVLCTPSSPGSPDLQGTLTPLPKSCTVSHALSSMCTSSSQCTSLSNQHVHGSSCKSLNHHHDLQVAPKSNSRLLHVRPFAFRWLTKLDKSKLSFKKSKQI